MPYSNFTLDTLRSELNLATVDKTGLFRHIAEVENEGRSDI